MSKATKVSGKQAAIDYLTEKGGGPLPVNEVTAAAAERAGLKGKTPKATVAAMIYTGAKKGLIFKVPARGMVELLPVTEAPEAEADTVETTATTETETPAVEKPATSEKRTAKPHPKPTGSGGSRKREKVTA